MTEKKYGHEWCTTAMAQDALALLKELGAYHSLYCVCGNCGAWLLDDQKFCYECGRKVKWE